jgi:hypothetical protein
MRTLLVLCCLMATAGADVLGLGAGTAAIFGVGQAWYWRNGGSASRGDWALPFTWGTIGRKLDGDGLRFDGDGFDTNALKHPLFGTSVYALARANGYSRGGSFLYATAISLAWETFGEWREYASINDLLATSTSGTPIGEALHQIARHWSTTELELDLGAGKLATGTGAQLSARAAVDLGDGEAASLALAIPYDLRREERDGIEGRDFTGRSTLGSRVVRREGTNLLAVGLASEFTYHELLADPVWDLFAAAKAGPMLDAVMTDGSVTVRAGVDATADFAMLRSFAFDAWRAQHPGVPVRAVLANTHPYYYAAGITVAPRLAVEYRGIEAGGTLGGSLFRSLDGHDRAVDDGLALRDTETIGEGWVAVRIGAAVLRVDVRARHRASSIGSATGAYAEHTALASVGVRL